MLIESGCFDLVLELVWNMCGMDVDWLWVDIFWVVESWCDVGE